MNPPIDISSVVLHTARLTLRPWRQEDLDDFYAYASVDGVGQMAGWLPHQSKAETQTILDLFIRQKKTFALQYQNQVIGSLGIECYDEEQHPNLAPWRGREIGYALAKPFWGRGLATEAARAAIDYLFRAEDLDFIIAGHFTRNARSARVIEKCGFRYLSTIPYETQYGTIETSVENILWNPARPAGL